MPDEYMTYCAMAAVQQEGRDFVVDYAVRTSAVAILAIHGGKIEPHTDELARDIAGDDFSYYVLRGQRASENMRFLHIASERFEEPRVLEVLRASQNVVSLHGAAHARQPFVMMGGLDNELRDTITAALEGAGFSLRQPPRRLAALSSTNVCNRGRRRVGVQLELSAHLRRLLATQQELHTSFCEAVRQGCMARPRPKVEGPHLPGG